MVDLTGINKVDKTANIQYSYPIAKVTNITPTSYFLNFYGLSQNFSASFNGTYISGVCIKATIITPKHKINYNHYAELVLEHKKSDNSSFYVVIPLVQDSQAKSQLDILVDTYDPESKVIDLNLDLKNIKSNMICYQDTSNYYVYVFENPIKTKTQIPSQSFDKFKNIKIITTGSKKKKNRKTTSTAFRITKSQNVEDELECEYVTETDANATPADTKMVTTIVIWVFILLGLVLCVLYSLMLISTKADADSANTIYMVVGGISIILLTIYIRLFTNTSTRKIQYGSMTIFSIIAIILSLLAYNGYFVPVKI